MSYAPMSERLDTVIAHYPRDRPTKPAKVTLPSGRVIRTAAKQTTVPENAKPAGRGWTWELVEGVRAETGTQHAGSSVRLTFGPSYLWTRTPAQLAEQFPGGELYGVHYATDYAVPVTTTDNIAHPRASWGSLCPVTHRHSRYAMDLVETTSLRWAEHDLSRNLERAPSAGRAWRVGDGATVVRGQRSGQQVIVYHKTADAPECTGSIHHYLDQWERDGYDGLRCLCPELPTHKPAYKDTCERCDHWYFYSPVARLECRFGREHFAPDDRRPITRVEELVDAPAWTRAALNYRCSVDSPELSQPWQALSVDPIKRRGRRVAGTLDGLRRYHRDRATGHLRSLQDIDNALSLSLDDDVDSLEELLQLINSEPTGIATKANAARDLLTTATAEFLSAARDELLAPRRSSLRTSTEHRHYMAGLQKALDLARRIDLLTRK